MKEPIIHPTKDTENIKNTCDPLNSIKNDISSINTAIKSMLINFDNLTLEDEFNSSLKELTKETNKIISLFDNLVNTIRMNVSIYEKCMRQVYDIKDVIDKIDKGVNEINVETHCFSNKFRDDVIDLKNRMTVLELTIFN